jgi:hypothetical protein
MDFEILCRAPKLTHDRALPCMTIKSARQSAFIVQFAAVRSLPCVFEKNARQNLCRAFYRLCRAPRTHGNPTYSRSVYDERADLERANRSFVVMLPKHQTAARPSDFRPICLQNFPMKIF